MTCPLVLYAADAMDQQTLVTTPSDVVSSLARYVVLKLLICQCYHSGLARLIRICFIEMLGIGLRATAGLGGTSTGRHSC